MVSKKLINSKSIYCWYAKSNLKRKWHGSAEYYHQDYTYDKDFPEKFNNKQQVLFVFNVDMCLVCSNNAYKNTGLVCFIYRIPRVLFVFNIYK